jgi:hypothetical protein
MVSASPSPPPISSEYARRRARLLAGLSELARACASGSDGQERSRRALRAIKRKQEEQNERPHPLLADASRNTLLHLCAMRGGARPAKISDLLEEVGEVSNEWREYGATVDPQKELHLTDSDVATVARILVAEGVCSPDDVNSHGRSAIMECCGSETTSHSARCSDTDGVDSLSISASRAACAADGATQRSTLRWQRGASAALRCCWRPVPTRHFSMLGANLWRCWPATGTRRWCPSCRGSGE